MNKIDKIRIKSITNMADKSLFGPKEHDYNPNDMALNNYHPFGLYSSFTYIRKHLLRLESLTLNNKTPKNESIEENWADLLNYVRIGYAIWRENDKPL